MPRGILDPVQAEEIVLSARIMSENEHGEEFEAFAPVPGVTHARVQPVSLTETATAGLAVDRETLRLYLPPARFDLPARVTLRGRSWRVVSAEHWTSYTLATVQST